MDSLDAVDSSTLHGRRIALDPGHGGSFRGSLGVGGLTEAEVNLGVALELRRLLEARGAVVFMTRDRDRDFLSPGDSALRTDLAERTRIANEFRPDLFVSIHHNADAAGAHDKNEIQTYYKLGDEGPSLDAAQSFHRFLKRNLAIERHRILPGNYYVLRNSVAPAILTEASYLTNPDVEARLALPDKRRLEAEALYLGLAHYFARRPPVVETFAASPAPGSADPRAARWLGPEIEARVRGGFDRVELRIDGEPMHAFRAGQRVSWSPTTALAAGGHRATLEVRLTGRGSAPQAQLEFSVQRPLRRIWVRALPESLGPQGGPFAVRAELVDALGLPVRDSLAVRLRVVSGSRRLADTLLIAREGTGWGYVHVAPKRSAGILTASVVERRSGIEGAARIPISSSPPLVLGGFLSFEPESLWSAGQAWVSPHGLAWLRRGAEVPSLPGWRPIAPIGGSSGVPLRWTALAGGTLHGRRVLLDPDGGGNDTAGMGPSGTRAALMNVEVARMLEGYLRAAGAEVRMSRVGDVDASDVERVRASEAFRADRYLRIAHRPSRPRLGHYFSSPAGRQWAERTAGELRRLGLPALPIVEEAQYPLQQTSCPALFASLARVDDPRDEERLHAPGVLRAQAYALFLGLAREWASDASWPLDSIEVVSQDGHPVPGALITLGGALMLETGADGKVRFARLEPGPLAVEVQHPRLSARATLLDSSRGIQVTGPRGE